MDNKKKAELRQIVKSIPKEEIGSTNRFLYEKYGYEFSPRTVRNYLIALRPDKNKGGRKDE